MLSRNFAKSAVITGKLLRNGCLDSRLGATAAMAQHLCRGKQQQQQLRSIWNRKILTNSPQQVEGSRVQASKSKQVKCQHQQLPHRAIWGYVAIAFNRVDGARLKLVGAERLCAEWLLKNSAGIGLKGLPGKVIRDYNSLPPENIKFRIQLVDGSNSSIMKIGFDHFIDCKNIDTVILHNCKHLEEDGLEGLLHLKDTLHSLQVSGCYNLKDEDLRVIGQLKNLRHLRMFDLPYVKDLQAVVKNLLSQLPACEITTTQ